MIRSVRRSDFAAITRITRDHYEQYGDPLFPITDSSFNQMLHNFMCLPYFKVMAIDNQIVGWFAASSTHGQLHSSVTALSQLYYHTILTGLKAVKALKAFHAHFFSHAERLGLQVAVTSSYLPNSNAFQKVLVKEGWLLWRTQLRKPTKHHNCQAERTTPGRWEGPVDSTPLRDWRLSEETQQAILAFNKRNFGKDL